MRPIAAQQLSERNRVAVCVTSQLWNSKSDCLESSEVRPHLFKNIDFFLVCCPASLFCRSATAFLFPCLFLLLALLHCCSCLTTRAEVWMNFCWTEVAKLFLKAKRTHSRGEKERSGWSFTLTIPKCWEERKTRAEIGCFKKWRGGAYSTTVYTSKCVPGLQKRVREGVQTKAPSPRQPSPNCNEELEEEEISGR